MEDSSLLGLSGRGNLYLLPLGCPLPLSTFEYTDKLVLYSCGVLN